MRRFLVISFQCIACISCIGAAALAWLLLAGSVPAFSQPLTFGSADDPREQIQQVWWKRENTFEAMGGLSLIGAQWRTAATIGTNIVSRSVTARFSGTLRAGIYGSYKPDIDEPYDLLRLVEFARYNPPRDAPFFLRAGPIDRMRLGAGHVVNFFNSYVAWDERTVGAEGAWRAPAGEIAAFTDNLLADGVVGARAGLMPFYWAPDFRTRSFTVGLNYATDLNTRKDGRTELTAYNVDLSFDALRSGSVRFSPFASVAWYSNYGSGIGFGADLDSPNFIDLARFRLRLGLYYNSKEFIPGYVGSFYTVSNPYARICNSGRSGTGCDFFAGVPLANALGGNDLLTELRLLVFERMEFWYYFRRHYGSQALSEYHIRMFLRAADRVSIDVGMDRGGLRGFFSLFSDLGDQTALVFNTRYRVAGPVWVYIRARYSFERLSDGPDGGARYLIQRRFEPFSGIRLTF